MFQKYINFIRGVSVNWVGRIGVILTTSSFISFIIIEFGRLTGLIVNSYIGLITFLVFPALFVFGLILIPISWYIFRKSKGKTTHELLNERFEPFELKTDIIGSSVFLTVLGLTLINILFVGGASFRMVHFMDSPQFCGTACHTVMNPEWTTYQVSPHARVQCIECHVGEGMTALFHSKLNGLWQIISVTFKLYEKPIPTPIHQLRPARETCEKCHWPEKFYGSRLKTIVHYGEDYHSTPLYTTLNLKIDAGEGYTRAGIHWHINEKNNVRYTSVDDKREQIIQVEVTQPDGTVKTFKNRDLTNTKNESKHIRTMDCVDCHNRATHIYELPENALDDRIHRRIISRELPYIKREALKTLTTEYPDSESAEKGFRIHLDGFYQRHYPELLISKMDQIDSIVETLKTIYDRNIHHGMNINWASYPSHIGHKAGSGCFRCHNSSLRDNEGNSISQDCTLCHSILADKENEPFEYIKSLDPDNPEYPMQEYLRKEFLNYFIEE